MMGKIYKFAIVGGGPAGLFAFNILNNKFFGNDIVLLEKEKKVCSHLESYGEYVKNYRSVESKKWDFLVTSKYRGIDITRYFRKNYPAGHVVCNVNIISKDPGDGFYTLSSREGKVYLAKKVILATGLKLKKIDAIEKMKNKRFDLTDRHSSELKEIDYENKEIILVGSGDNVLFKANKIAQHIAGKYTRLKHVPITILVKGSIDPQANPKFKNDVSSFVSKGLVKLINNCWDIEEIVVNNSGLISKIVSDSSEYLSKARDGAYMACYIGFEPNIPKLLNCDIGDITTIGDMSLHFKGLPISITESLEDVERRVEAL